MQSMASVTSRLGKFVILMMGESEIRASDGLFVCCEQEAAGERVFAWEGGLVSGLSRKSIGAQLAQARPGEHGKGSCRRGEHTSTLGMGRGGDVAVQQPISRGIPLYLVSVPTTHPS